MGEPRIVILGAGFAGLAVGRELRRRAPEAEVILVDRHNYFLFTPLLAEAATGMLDPRHAVVPLRSFFRSARTHQAEIMGVEPERRRVLLRHGEGFGPHDHELSYDQLVVALGSSTGSFGIPGLEERAYTLKSLGDALTVHNRILDALEQAELDPEGREELLTFVVGGGAFSGVELAGAMADFLGRAVAQYPSIGRSQVRIVIAEMKDRLLPELPERMGTYARWVLERKGVEVRLGRGVESTAEDRVRLSGGEEVRTRTLVWTGGVVPAPGTRTLGLPLDDAGHVIVDRAMRVVGHPDVWALGDCAAVPNGEGGIQPPTAQHAIRQGSHVGRNVARVLRGSSPRPFSYDAQGMLVALGHDTGFADLRGRAVTGRTAWLLWRGYYLLRMPGAGRKLRVATDWAMNALTGPSLVELPLWARVPKDERRQLESPAGPAVR